MFDHEYYWSSITVRTKSITSDLLNLAPRPHQATKLGTRAQARSSHGTTTTTTTTTTAISWGMTFIEAIRRRLRIETGSVPLFHPPAVFMLVHFPHLVGRNVRARDPGWFHEETVGAGKFILSVGR
ncbi:MAG: hypothetical protein GYA24_06235 [Candidatus Lokiarchaeota archaeon]|nr:hypothetical protein [Candidatus Lokiarchaeota archaeon]